MKRIITNARMKSAEINYMEKTKTPSSELMERAAQAILSELLTFSGRGLFLCGPGNNGGDGYAAARLLHEMRRPVTIWAVADPETLTGDARENMLRCRALQIPILSIDAFEAPPKDTGVIVDALFGTGMRGPLVGRYAEAVRFMNASGLPVLAVDMPSGDVENMVHAEVTVTFHRMKPCHLLFPGRKHAGRVVICDIGLPDEAFHDDFELLEEKDIARLLPPRAVDTHKGDCGHALVIAGSLGMAGAAALCAGGALRGGAGLVTALCPGDVLPIVQTLAPCAMACSIERLEEALLGKHSLAIGPGLSRAASLEPLFEAVLACVLPQVWDADALFWLAENPQALRKGSVMTPHPGEAARLLGCTVSDIINDPVAAAEALHDRYRATVLLKGATTLIIGDSARAIDISGTPGMATGGSGDVLTGLIAALLAQGLSPFQAAQLGAYLHGRAGKAAARTHGERSMTAMDLLCALRID